MRRFINPTSGAVESYDSLVFRPEVRDKLLNQARQSSTPVYCPCQSQKRAALVVFSSTLGHLFLRARPRDGDSHRPGCEWVSTTAANAQAVFTLDAAKENARGILEIGLRGGLAVNRGGADLDEHRVIRPHRSASSAVKRPQTSLLGLLEILWHRAALHVVHPPEPAARFRTHGFVTQSLISALETVAVSGRKASEITFIGTGHANNEQLAIEFWKRKTSPAVRRLIIGEFGEYRPPLTGICGQLKLHCLPTTLALAPNLWEQAVDSYGIPSACSDESSFERQDDGIRYWVIAKCEKTATRFVVERLAWLKCSRDNITVDSSYEARVANALVRTGWSFVKPLRYEGEEVFPDFEVLGPGFSYPLEVWGVTGNPEYDRRKAEKLIQYNGRVWQWTPTSRTEPVPAFTIIADEMKRMALGGSPATNL